MSDPKTPAEALAAAYDIIFDRKHVKDKHLWDNDESEEEPWE